MSAVSLCQYLCHKTGFWHQSKDVQSNGPNGSPPPPLHPSVFPSTWLRGHVSTPSAQWCCLGCAFVFESGPPWDTAQDVEQRHLYNNNNNHNNKKKQKDINSLKLLVRVYWSGIKSQFFCLNRSCVVLLQAISLPPSQPCWGREKANNTPLNFHLSLILQLWVHAVDAGDAVELTESCICFNPHLLLLSRCWNVLLLSSPGMSCIYSLLYMLGVLYLLITHQHLPYKSMWTLCLKIITILLPVLEKSLTFQMLLFSKYDKTEAFPQFRSNVSLMCW